MVALICAVVGVGFYLILENFIQFFWEVFPERVADPVLGGHLWAKYLTMVAVRRDLPFCLSAFSAFLPFCLSAFLPFCLSAFSAFPGILLEVTFEGM